MSRSSSPGFVIPVDYRKAAEHLFPKDGFSRVHKPDFKSAIEYAKVLGVGTEYQRVLALNKKSEELQKFLHHFKSNLDLLIQKTWVEKSEERRKDSLHSDTLSFMGKLEQEDYHGAINDFSAILKELSYLLFGNQSEKDDFTEYTFRIDAQMGLFWWYGSRLKEFGDNASDVKFLWAILLLGICYLTNF